MAQEQINALLVEHALAGRRVVRLKGGDPFVFGRGMEELEACVAAGVPVEVVPGITSAIAVPALAGIPVTHRGLTHEFVVVSGHLPPGHPQSLVDWAALGRLRGTRRRPHGRGHRAGHRGGAGRARAGPGRRRSRWSPTAPRRPSARCGRPWPSCPDDRRRGHPAAGRLGGRRGRRTSTAPHAAPTGRRHRPRLRRGDVPAGTSPPS